MQTITELAWLLVRVNADHVQGTLVKVIRGVICHTAYIRIRRIIGAIYACVRRPYKLPHDWQEFLVREVQSLLCRHLNMSIALEDVSSALLA